MEKVAAGHSMRPVLLFPEVRRLSSQSAKAVFQPQLCLVGRLVSSRDPQADAAGLLQGTTTNGKMLLPFKSGAFLAGVPVQPCFIKYETNRVSPSWDSINALWHTFLMFATLHHSVTVYLVRAS